MATVDISGQLTRWVVTPVMVGMAVVVGMIGLHGAQDATVLGYQALVEHSQNPNETLRATQYQSVVDQVRDKVPGHVRVYVVPTPPFADIVASEWYQRLPEIAMMQGHEVVADGAKAAYWLQVVVHGRAAVLVVEKKN